MRVAIYLRVSTKEQTTDNQRLELEHVSQARGWTVAKVYEDAGISGAKGRDKRPAFDAMLKDATRGQFDMIAAWSVDRLGRSMSHLVSFLDDLQATGCGLYLHQQALDTSTPSGRAMFQMVGVFAEFERAMFAERVQAGLTRAREQGKRLGRPMIPSATDARIRDLRAQGWGKLRIARELGIGTSAVQRVTGTETPSAR